MYLCSGKIDGIYNIKDIMLPFAIKRRLEALGMTQGTLISILNSKSHGALIVKVRGTRFALGKNITQNILVR